MIVSGWRFAVKPLTAAAVAGYVMADRALDPIGQMAQRAEQITTERLPRSFAS